MHRILFVLSVLVVAECLADEPWPVSRSTFVGSNYGFATGSSQPLGEEGTVSLVVEVDVYLKNLELTRVDPIQGETYFSFITPLRARYRAHETLTVEAGVLLRHDFGDPDRVDNVDPIVRLVYEAAPDMFILAGTILPTHWIHDALFDDLQRFRQPAEQGLQFRVDRPTIKQDFWFNWRVKEEADVAEQFEVGNTTQVRLFEQSLWLDFQCLNSHIGGQINDTNQVLTNLSVLLGGSYGIPLGGDEQEVRVGGRYFWQWQEWDFNPSERGDGWEAIITVLLQPGTHTRMRIYGAYFDGDEFDARLGDPLFSLDNHARLGLDVWFEANGDMQIGLGLVVHINENEVNYSFQIIFAWGRDFRLASTRP